MRVAECVECAREWAHCHGAWVVHDGGDASVLRLEGECTDGADCVTPAEAHPHVVSCEEVRPGCCR